ncbi:hypothetical protein N7490_003205 [Penicillium lividum]|nr:hypothetical protein N7490_003205 [Penicillium lividum]
MFWVIIHRVANSAFKDLNLVEKVLITTDGPIVSKVLSFSSLYYNNTKLAIYNRFKDKLQVYGIRGRLRHPRPPKKAEFVKKWWDALYTEYIAGNDFSERDIIHLFDIYRKYILERDRLSENLFEEVTLDSFCLTDMVALYKSTERVAYYPRILLEKGKYAICSRPISR